MNRRKVTLGVAGAGVVAGVVALSVLAAPAGAGQSPALPAITPQALVQSVLAARVPAMAGTVDIQNNLGLPPLPGVPLVDQPTSTLRVWVDGDGRTRLSLPNMNGERDIIDDGTTIYTWNSDGRTVTEHPRGTDLRRGRDLAKGVLSGADNESLDPATAGRQLIGSIRATSDVTVDGTDIVASRPAYDLVLTPKPDERTLLREVRVSVDAQTRIPLRLSVLANNTGTPAIQIGFSNIDLGAQDPALFHFTPPPGSTVGSGDATDRNDAAIAGRARATIVGSGWDTVVVGGMPAGLRAADAHAPGVMELIQRFGTPVSGPWGSGWVIQTNIATALITADGRAAGGFVPEQVLTDTLGHVK